MNITLAFLSVGLQACLAVRFSSVAKLGEGSNGITRTEKCINFEDGEARLELRLDENTLKIQKPNTFVYLCKGTNAARVMEEEDEISKPIEAGNFIIFGKEELGQEIGMKLFTQSPLKRRNRIRAFERWLEKQGLNVFAVLVEDDNEGENKIVSRSERSKTSLKPKSTITPVTGLVSGESKKLTRTEAEYSHDIALPLTSPNSTDMIVGLSDFRMRHEIEIETGTNNLQNENPLTIESDLGNYRAEFDVSSDATNYEIENSSPVDPPATGLSASDTFYEIRDESEKPNPSIPFIVAVSSEDEEPTNHRGPDTTNPPTGETNRDDKANVIDPIDNDSAVKARSSSTWSVFTNSVKSLTRKVFGSCFKTSPDNAQDS